MLEESSDEQIATPPTIQALLAARLDQLDADERTVLEAAAVEGEVFHLGAVRALTPDEPLTAQLTALVRKEFVRPVPSRVRRRGRIPLPPPAAARRDLRRDPEGRTLGPARTLRRLARAARRRDSTRSSATTSNRHTDSGRSSAAPTPSSAPGRDAFSARPGGRRSAEPTCRQRSPSLSGRARCSRTTRRRSFSRSSARHSSTQAGSRRPTTCSIA